MAVGCTSLGSFGSRFTELVGETPSAYRARDYSAYAAMPACVMKALGKPSRNGRLIRIQEAARPNPALELPT